MTMKKNKVGSPIWCIIVIIIIISTFKGANAQYVFDSTQINKIRLIIEDNKFLKVENDSLSNRCLYYKKILFNSDLIISMQDSIISNKEKQLKQLESIPKTVINVNYTKWYIFAGIVLTSISAGLITGLILK